ncbi:DUF3570 domain-containing protein [Chitinophaga oryziterrae]|uniref:DUF3570 domain-containing protein n=1 Tax=Chitinophaga oryziterrae TaxID=1031224 RepID=A0A6N8J9I6_9BACT|nr:DUF3570 domain-containing protein [Chitinophaga oryziterrae]MVT41783.1 DUF3570 domain-containing protein [Chitinophaga oryziterrae]
MKKICLSVLGLYIGMLAAFSQDTSQYKSRKLTFEEANFISSYYNQNGNNSAVTGGIGTEKLTDLSNSFEIKLNMWDKKERKHTFDFELGIDHYTSASSDKIDPKTISSASHADTRLYPSLNWSVENGKKGTTFGAGLSVSHEFDYTSFGMNVLFAKKTNNKSGEFSVKLQAYLDKLKLIQPVELRSYNNTYGENDYPTASRNSFSTSLSYSQIINQRLQVIFLADVIYQHGYLGLPFHRIYFKDGTESVETLPADRLKVPLGVRANYFLGDNIILRGYYRYYRDSWGLEAHTANIETSVKVTPFLSVTPFYRYYIQSAVKYFAPYEMHTSAEEYYTSNYDLSKFTSGFFGAGFRLIPPKGVFGIQHFNMLELRYGHYQKNNGMQSNIVSLNIRIK